jgi:hypothetical protein
MRTKNLNNRIDEVVKKQGIEKYCIKKIALKKGVDSVTPEGELVCDLFIDVVILPIKRYFQLPITFSIKLEDNEC